MKKPLKLISIIFLVLAVSLAVFIKMSYVLPVLMYHSIDENDKVIKLRVSPKSFEAQMEFLHKNHYNVVGPDKVVAYLEKKEKMPPKTVAITFDDGFYNNYKYAYPVLKKYNFPATIFVITSKIGKEGWLGWNELIEMSNSGVITIGSHTQSHLWLPSLDDTNLKDELAGSKKILEERLGKKVNFLCYPIGAHDERVQAAVRAAGYKAAFGTNPGRFKSAGDIFAIKRVRISSSSNSLFVFWFESSGYYTLIKEYRPK